MLTQKYKLSGRPVLHLACQGAIRSSAPSHGYDILYLHIVSCPYSTATRYELMVSLCLWQSQQVVYIIYVLVELILGWKGGNAFTLIVT